MSNTSTKPILLNLPIEIFRLIMSEIIYWPCNDVEISVQRRIRGFTYGKKWRENHRPDLSYFNINNSLMRCSRATRNLVLNTFEAYNTFYSDNTEGFQRLPKLLRPEVFLLIRKLCLRMDDHTKLNDEAVFPGVLEVLCENLRDLRELRLFSEECWTKTEDPSWDSRDRKHFEGISRRQQNMRCLLRLMAFVVMRHPLLKRLILPTASATIVDPARRACNIENYLVADAGPLHNSQIEGQILNATALTTVQWSDLALIDPSDFAIAPPANGSNADIPSSLIPHTTGYFAPVIEQGYRTREYREWRGWQHRNVDLLIRKCQDMEARMLSIERQEQMARDVIDWSGEGDVREAANRSRWRRKRKTVEEEVEVQSQPEEGTLATW